MAKATKVTSLTEAAFREAKIDTEAGFIRGVKILGRESKNGRTYSDSAMAQAVRIYEGLGVNLNHPGKKEANATREFEAGIGWFENVTIKADGAYGDLGYFKTHPYAGVLTEAAQRRSTRFGMSHNAEGVMVRKDGKNVVESIERVHSVDLVQGPATTNGLFESEGDNLPAETVKLSEYVAGIDDKTPAKAFLVSILEMDEMSGMSGYGMDAPGEMDSEGRAKAALRALVDSVLDDETLDAAAMSKKIASILKFGEREMSNKATEPAADESKLAADKQAASDKAAADKAAFEAVEKQKLDTATEILEAAGVKEDVAIKAKALASLTDTAERKKLVESFRPAPAKPAVEKPAFSRPLTEATAGEFTKDNKSFLRAIGAKPVKA